MAGQKDPDANSEKRKYKLEVNLRLPKYFWDDYMIILVEKFALFKEKRFILNEIFCSGEKILSKFAKLLKYERFFFHIS